MIYTSLAIVALSVSSAVMPLSKMVHLHPHSAQPDTRVSIVLHNTAPVFQDVKVGGQSYTIHADQELAVKAPAGTVVYLDSSTGRYHRGDVLVQLSAADNRKTINLP